MESPTMNRINAKSLSCSLSRDDCAVVVLPNVEKSEKSIPFSIDSLGSIWYTVLYYNTRTRYYSTPEQNISS